MSTPLVSAGRSFCILSSGCWPQLAEGLSRPHQPGRTAVTALPESQDHLAWKVTPVVSQCNGLPKGHLTVSLQEALGRSQQEAVRARPGSV